MLPFKVEFRPGIAAYEQVVYAAKRAIVCNKILIGSRFPSVRELSQELKINPNTAHKVVSRMVADGLLESKPGVGMIVAKLPIATIAQRTQLLDDEMEQLVVQAKKLRLRFDEVRDALATQWELMGGFSRSEGGRR